MYKQALDKLIQSGKVSNSFVFFGESSFLIDTYTKMLSNIEDASTLSFYYDEYNFKSAKAHLSQSSLFGGQNILIIKSDKKIPKKELDEFINLCEKNRDNILIYAYYGDNIQTYSAKTFLAKTDTIVVRFFHPNHHEALSIVQSVVNDKKVKMDKFSINHLLSIHNGDVALACNEIDKLSIYDKEITTKDIEHLVSGLAEISIDDFIKNTLNKKEFTEDLLNIIDHGEDEIRVITSLTSYLTQLYMFNIYIRVNGAPNPIEILGYKPPKVIVDEKAALSLKFKPQTYYKLHSLLLDSELKMKSSNVDKGAILLSTLIRVQALI
ncbi:DNA polymerase III subunit delta [Sulfurimonas sp.]|uniref:DNA polymerase III subunit delta n=1 Tax=Sulfurimonas sp. TaxID=2022749 RepID=UPI002B4AAB0D|nr:DNA polymerase III subunit delta [Sulfurimonas sp.]